MTVNREESDVTNGVTDAPRIDDPEDQRVEITLWKGGSPRDSSVFDRAVGIKTPDGNRVMVSRVTGSSALLVALPRNARVFRTGDALIILSADAPEVDR